MSMGTTRTSNSMTASRREACADTLQSRVSGSLSEPTMLRFVRRIVKADSRFLVGSNRVVAGVNGMIVVGIPPPDSSYQIGPPVFERTRRKIAFDRKTNVTIEIDENRYRIRNNLSEQVSLIGRGGTRMKRLIPAMNICRVGLLETAPSLPRENRR